jgi:predicted DNA-binding protein
MTFFLFKGLYIVLTTKLLQKRKVYIINQSKLGIMEALNPVKPASSNQEQENKTTTIKISETTKERLNHLKEHKEESADTLITKALNIINLCARSPSLAARILRDIEKSKKRKELLENPESMIKRKNPGTNSQNKGQVKPNLNIK